MPRKDGEKGTGEPVYRARGDAQRPLAPPDLRAKFIDCFAAGKSTIDAARLLEKLQHIETWPSCRQLYCHEAAELTA